MLFIPELAPQGRKTDIPIASKGCPDGITQAPEYECTENKYSRKVANRPTRAHLNVC